MLAHAIAPRFQGLATTRHHVYYALTDYATRLGHLTILSAAGRIQVARRHTFRDSPETGTGPRDARPCRSPTPPHHKHVSSQCRQQHVTASRGGPGIPRQGNRGFGHCELTADIPPAGRTRSPTAPGRGARARARPTRRLRAPDQEGDRQHDNELHRTAPARSPRRTDRR